MKILLLRLSSMGDILLATPVPEFLKKIYPGSEIHWVVYKNFEDSIRNNPNIDKIIAIEKADDLTGISKFIRSSEYDLIFDLHKNSKTYFLTSNLKNVFRYNKRLIERFLLVFFKRKYNIIPATKMYFAALNKAGIKTPDKWDLGFYPDPDSETATVRKYGLEKEPYAVFIPGASYFTKIWPEEYFKKLAEMMFLEDKFKKIIVVGKGKNEEMTGRFICGESNEKRVNLTGKLNLDETAAVLKYADIIISNDNGPMHLAECFKKKTVAIFGCTTEELGFFPYSTDFKVVEMKGLKCRPCTHFGRKKCPKGHFKCMRNITPESVYKTITDFLK
ncbi:MAG: hypothetical protein A2Y39_02020 [Candidatus Delongbacteria bacterium GWF2_40_14]|nr:MAG: hypothetical protein A2Y39_02020 [Candidatus Delongbacteria bacterium GWF2_40_14]